MLVFSRTSTALPKCSDERCQKEPPYRRCRRSPPKPNLKRRAKVTQPHPRRRADFERRLQSFPLPKALRKIDPRRDLMFQVMGKETLTALPFGCEVKQAVVFAQIRHFAVVWLVAHRRRIAHRPIEIGRTALPRFEVMCATQLHKSQAARDEAQAAVPDIRKLLWLKPW